MATYPPQMMQQAAQARMPQPTQPGQPQPPLQGQQGNPGFQVSQLLDQAKTITLQPQNFTTVGPVMTDFARNWILSMIQLAKQKGATGGPAASAPGQMMSPSPAPMQPGAPAQPAPSPVGTR